MAGLQFAQKSFLARILHFGRSFSRVDSDALLGHTVKSNLWPATRAVCGISSPSVSAWAFYHYSIPGLLSLDALLAASRADRTRASSYRTLGLLINVNGCLVEELWTRTLPAEASPGCANA